MLTVSQMAHGLAQSTWLHGDVWDIEDAANFKNNGIVKIENNITTNQDVKTAGLIIDANKTLTVHRGSFKFKTVGI
jgi:hypothetical protein